MKQYIKRLVRKMLHPLVLKLGYEEKRVANSPDLLDEFCHLLLTLDFKPLHIVDVGANHGNWTRSALRYFPDAYYTLLEPQHWLEKSISDLLAKNKKISFNPVGAGSQAGSFKFTVVDRDDSSSFRFTDADAQKHGFSQIDVPVVTLNSFINELNRPVPDIVKIDAEGLDIEVLKGASGFFGKTEIFMVEAGVGSTAIENSFLNIINFMDQHNYRLFDITDINRPFDLKVLWLTELVFVRKNGIIDGSAHMAAGTI
jgi:FkbM family methyltransferase